MRPAYTAHNGHLVFDAMALPENSVIRGDCITVMTGLSAETVDFVQTDPPYICNYRDRQGLTIANDTNGDWPEPAFREIYRLMKPDTLCISFYGWTATEAFLAAWVAAGFRRVGHTVFCKDYASRTGLFAARHECAYVLAKGRPHFPDTPLSDVSGWVYTGNKLHPTQKPIEVLDPLVGTYCPQGGNGTGPVLWVRFNAGRSRKLWMPHVEVARKRLFLR
ncbi:site-specific DNA-methyltransferase (adenine-specific) [Rhizobium sp. RAS22]|nr:site-specific DNA-methyltransferase (adenine-specific) [Rhizobium sp. RAS22]